MLSIKKALRPSSSTSSLSSSWQACLVPLPTYVYREQTDRRPSFWHGGGKGWTERGEKRFLSLLSKKKYEHKKALSLCIAIMHISEAFFGSGYRLNKYKTKLSFQLLQIWGEIYFANWIKNRPERGIPGGCAKEVVIRLGRGGVGGFAFPSADLLVGNQFGFGRHSTFT